MYRVHRPLFILLGGLALLAASGAVQAQAPAKIGVFDAQRISEETRAGKRAQAELEQLRADKQRQIETKEQEVVNLEQQLKTQKGVLAQDKLIAMQIDLRRRMLEAENMKELASRELQLELAAAEAQFNEKLGVVIEQFGRQEQFAAILERGAMAWYSPSIDITTVMIDMFDAMFPETGS